MTEFTADDIRKAADVLESLDIQLFAGLSSLMAGGYARRGAASGCHAIGGESMNLQDEVLAVVENLKSRPWIQGEMQDGDAVCAHGAVMTCQGLRPGDEWIIRAVMRTKGLTEGWNDESGRTKDEVITRLAHIGCTDEDLAETFGPSWLLVVAVIRRSALLTPAEATDLAAAWDAARDAAWDAAWDAARDAAGGAAWDAAWAAAGDAAGGAAGGAAGDAAGDAAWDAAGDAAWDAAWAAAVVYLVGQHGLTQGHVDTLMRPWVTVLGEDWAEGMA